jgi:ubiquinone/menaquinone biosynthesis C-methylase UbiE
MAPSRRADYGYDAPSGLFGFGGVALVLLVLALIHALLGRRVPALVEGLCGLLFLLTFLGYLYSTRKGKFLIWSELLKGFPLRGDEQVLDMGCGRGAVLSMIAKRIPNGRAFGLDLWSSVDQSGNNREATLANLEAESVRERCTVETGNMMAMPFPDAMFDAVVSSLAIHNIWGQAGRFKALEEAARVLKPGGRLMIVDLLFPHVYARHLRDIGMEKVAHQFVSWRGWFGMPLLTAVVTAEKPRRG